MGEFSSYSEWREEAKDGKYALYPPPVISAIDYFTGNPWGRSNKVGSDSWGGGMKYESKSKIEGNGAALRHGDFEVIAEERMLF